jgi:outer membrane protein OmpA-like peptidoglycan-associated protein
MRLLKIVFIVWILSFVFTGCSTKKDVIFPSQANRDIILLLPDAEGKVGVVQISTRGGSRVLDRAGYAVEVEDVGKPPSVPRPIEEKEMEELFGPLLSVQTDPAGRFIFFLLYFEHDTTKLTHESKALMNEVLRAIKNRKSSEIYLVGHTDLVGTEEYNTVLSSRRANHVRGLLVSNGIQPDTLFTSYYGKARPLVSTKDGVPEPRNRRVEIIVR